MILFVPLIAVISIFSPIIGLIVAIPYFTRKVFDSDVNSIDATPGKTPENDILKLFVIFSASIVFLKVISIISLLQGFEILISVALSATFFALILYRTKDFEIALLSGAVPGLLFIVIKNLFFFNYIREQFEQSNQLVMENIRIMFSPKMFDSIMPTILKIQGILLNGNVAIWMFSIILGIFIGTLIFSKKSESIKWNFASVTFPYYLQIGIAVSLILFILNQKILCYNLLTICGLFYLIQGYSLLYFILQRISIKSKLLGLIILIIPFLNIYLLFIISFIGFLDSWIHLRKFVISEGER